jgi:hypothetical protein
LEREDAVKTRLRRQRANQRRKKASRIDPKRGWLASVRVTLARATRSREISAIRRQYADGIDLARIA